jgi:hypothetical protein
MHTVLSEVIVLVCKSSLRNLVVHVAILLSGELIITLVTLREL